MDIGNPKKDYEYRSKHSADKESIFHSMRSSSYFLSIIIVIIIMIVSSLSSGQANNYSKFSWNKNSIKITDPTGSIYMLDYSDIISTDLKEISDYGTMVSGGQTKNSRYGIWSNKSFSNYHIYADKSINTNIVLLTTKGYVLINNESIDVTKQLFSYINSMLSSKQ